MRSVWALGRTLGEFNRGIIEILPKGAGKPSPADLDHLRDVAVASGAARVLPELRHERVPYVEKASREGAQLYNLLRAIPFNPRFTLKKTTFFHNLDVWDVVMQLRVPERLAALADPERRAKMRDQALKPQRRRPGVPGRLVPWSSIFVRKVKLATNQGLVNQSLTALAEKLGKHVADVMLDLALEEGLDTEFQLMTRSDAEENQIADMVKSGHALPTQSDAGAHLNTNFCTAGESSYVLGQWVRDRELLTLEDAIRRYTFQPARIMGCATAG
jgi:N-acyl-D-aspartate/D-glutamate deacylase